MSRTASGFLTGGLPFDRLGAGPRDVVVFPGLAFENRPASRMVARALLGPFRFLEREFIVHVVYRRPHLPRGSTISDMADDYAAMIRTELGGPVGLIGAMAEGMALMLLPRHGLGRWLTMPVQWLFALLGAIVPKPTDASDLVTTIEAEDTFDLSARLGQIRAPTLVVGGARDPFYSRELFRPTGAGIPAARLVLDPHGGHVPTGNRIAQAILGFLEAVDRTPEAAAERGSHPQ